jgi:hypothetical protein
VVALDDSSVVGDVASPVGVLGAEDVLGVEGVVPGVEGDSGR